MSGRFRVEFRASSARQFPASPGPVLRPAAGPVERVPLEFRSRSERALRDSLPGSERAPLRDVRSSSGPVWPGPARRARAERVPVEFRASGGGGDEFRAAPQAIPAEFRPGSEQPGASAERAPGDVRARSERCPAGFRRCSGKVPSEPRASADRFPRCSDGVPSNARAIPVEFRPGSGKFRARRGSPERGQSKFRLRPARGHSLFRARFRAIPAEFPVSSEPVPSELRARAGWSSERVVAEFRASGGGIPAGVPGAFRAVARAVPVEFRPGSGQCRASAASAPNKSRASSGAIPCGARASSGAAAGVPVEFRRCPELVSGRVPAEFSGRSGGVPSRAASSSARSPLGPQAVRRACRGSPEQVPGKFRRVPRDAPANSEHVPGEPRGVLSRFHACSERVPGECRRSSRGAPAGFPGSAPIGSDGIPAGLRAGRGECGRSPNKFRASSG